VNDLIIGITGLGRSGKNTVAEYLSKSYGFRHLDFNIDVIQEELKKRGMDATRENSSVLGDEMREKEGMVVMAKRIMMKMGGFKEGESFVLTGFRSPEEVDYIRNEAPGEFWLILIKADPTVRYERRDDPEQTEEGFFARDERDIQNKGMAKVFDLADHTINNNSSLENLYKEVDDLISRLEKEGEI
jgi:dephospho-CoA kinase